MRLERLSLILSILLSLTVLAMTVGRVHTAWEEVRTASGSFETIGHLRELLVVAEMASRERGPANGLLGDDLPHDSAKQARLSAAREKTDAAFAKLQHSIGSSAMRRPVVSQSVEQAVGHLALAREAVDRAARLPRGSRMPEDIRGVVAQMIGVIDDLRPAMLRLNIEAQASYPGAANILTVACMAADMREYAGQLGSQFTAALTKRAPLTAQERVAIERLRGRIELLRKQLVEQIVASGNRAALNTLVATMQERYFDAALPFVEAQVAIGESSGRYDVDAAGFAARYVPDMDSIVTLRDVLLNEAQDDALRVLEEKHMEALWSAGGGLLMLVLLGLILWLLNRRHPIGKTQA